MNEPKIYLHGLNGIRAIAALGVVISHVTIELGSFDLNPYLFGSFKDGNPIGLLLGGFGVSMFFALSGFLITYLLLIEQESFKNINVKNFYIRRVLRIWPLYYLYLGVALVIISLLKMPFQSDTFLLYVFFAANVPFILNTGLPLISHYWSLGVEEQFYAFWPWLVKKTKSGLIYVLITLTIFLIGMKIFLHFQLNDSILKDIINVTRFHCMMIGGIGAILYLQKNKLFLSLVDNKLSQSIGLFVVFLMAINKFHIISIIDNEIISLVTVVIIVGQINIKNRVLSLENKLFDYLGKISYGIYVIHPLIILLASQLFINLTIIPSIKYPIVYLTVIGLTVVMAHVSFKYFETYFLNLKHKFSDVQSTMTKKSY